MAAMLETPSRIWRRIEAIEDRDMPSLPSLPPFEDSDDVGVEEPSDILSQSDDGLNDMATAIHSTPAATSHGASTFRAASSTSSTARFARSIASRSTKSSTGPSAVVGKRRSSDSFNVSKIPSLPKIQLQAVHSNETDSDMDDSHHDLFIPAQEGQYEDDDLSISDALQSISRSSSPAYACEKEKSPKKSYDYSMGLKSEPKPSPVDRFRNVALRRPPSRNRTPSLTHTLTSTSSSSTNDTPISARAMVETRSNSASSIPAASIPLPPSRVASESPVVIVHRPGEDGEDEQRSMSQSMQMQSMDITDVQISPPQLGYQSDQNDGQQTETEDEHAQHSQVNDRDGLESHETGLDEATSGDEPEPTFSSEAEQTAHGRHGGYGNGPTFTRLVRDLQVGASGAQSSPAQSLPFTPTPAFPRPRARFIPSEPEDDDLPTPRPHEDHYQQPEEDEDGEGTMQQIHQENRVADDDDIMTPHTRRRSFLLSVINSTARPRLAYPTPHPHHLRAAPLDTPGSIVTATPATAVRPAFSGITPRPRFQPASATSQQSSLASQTQSNTEAPSSGTKSSTAKVRWATPGPRGTLSPQLPAENASFISTASSHDLTTHQRVNTSFDPAMGFGAGGSGNAVGRFNAGKLNTYLHSLNRRLQEENEVLLEKLKKLQREKEGIASEKHQESLSTTFSAGTRRSSGGRRNSGGTVLGDVREDVIEERWQEEKAELEELVESCREEVTRFAEEKEELERKLETERKERERDKQRWKDRIAELEDGVEGIVKDMERRLGKSEEAARMAEEERDQQVRNLTRQLTHAQNEQAMALERAGKAERALESDQELGSELKEAHERLDKAMADLQGANLQIQDLEQELTKATNHIVGLEDELAVADQELQRTSSAELTARQQSQRLEADARKAQDLAEQMEDALKEAEREMTYGREIQAELNAKVDSLERELEREKERRVDPSRDLAGPTEADIQALEDELDAANREVARLNAMMTQSPARKAVDKAKDMRIELLERENEELMERNKALRTAMNEMNTPNKLINNSKISPIHRQVLSMSIRAPRTPGGPLKDLSWLNSTHDPSVSPLVAEITRLHRELDRANESIDDKLDKLQDAGLGVVGLTEKLEDARAKIIALEDEISRLSRREDRLMHRLERIRCQKCQVKLDVRAVTTNGESFLDSFKDNLPAEPETPPTRTSEGLRAELRSVNVQLENLKKQWEDEKQQLLGENAALQDRTNRLNVQVKAAQDEARAAYESGRAGEKGKEGELEKAKRVILDLEEKLKGERKHLRTLITEQDRLQRDKDDVLSQLQRTELDMEDVRQQLLAVKQENHDLEKELRMNATAEQKARILEGRVTENLETIEQLRHERSLLTTDHKQLQRRFTELTEQANELRSKYSATSSSHEKRRHQLDLYCVEIGDLHRAFSEQASELRRTEEEKGRITAEKEGVAKVVASLEADLRRVKRDAEAFGRDLKRLRVEKENIEESHHREIARLQKAKKQANSHIRHLSEQLELQKDAAHRAREEMRKHSCVVDDSQLTALKLQHNKECKGLIVQIKYLKAKFTRESGLRTNLCYQKQYLLLLLARYEKSEMTIFASIARIGFPVSPPPIQTGRPKFRSIAFAVVFSFRAKRASQVWREQCSAKEAIAVALQEVRQRRTTKGIGS